MLPQMVHCIEFWCSSRKPAQFNAHRFCKVDRIFCGMRRAPVLIDDDVPSSPCGSNLFQEMHAGLTVPFMADQQVNSSGTDVDCSVEDPLGPISSNRYRDLLSDMTICIVQWGRFSNDCFVQHQNHCSKPLIQAVFEPPFACFQYGSRSASTWRGRFHRIRKRVITRCTLSAETSVWCLVST